MLFAWPSKRQAAELGRDSEARTRYKEQELLSLTDDFVDDLNTQLEETTIKVFRADRAEFL